MKKTIITLFTVAAAIVASAQSTTVCPFPADGPEAIIIPLSITSDDCRGMALAHSEDIRIARNNVEGARLQHGVAKTGFLPNLSGTATAMYNPNNTDMMGMELVMKGTYMAGLNLTQPIYAGGRIVAGNNLARIGKKVSEEQLRLATMQTIAEADNAYWSYIAVLQKVKMMEAYKTQMDSLYTLTQRRMEAGMITRSDLLRIDARRSEIQYQLEKCVNGANLCRLSLCRILGVDSETPVVPLDTVIGVEAPGNLAYDINERPEYQLLNLNIDATNQQVKLVRGDYLPTLGLSLGFTHYGNIKVKGNVETPQGMMPFTQTYNGNSPMAILSLQVPLFHWGEGYKKVKKARLDVENARLELEKNSRLLDLEVRQAISNLVSGYTMIETAEIALEQARVNREVVRDRYEVNLASLTDLLDAESQWQQSYSNDIEARAQYRIFQTDYLRATGRLTR